MASELATSDRNPLLRKLTRLRELSLDADTQLLQLLKYAAPLIPENNLRARQKLRASLERQSLETSKELLQMLSNVRTTADSMCTQISSLNNTCKHMSTDIRAARVQAGDVLLKAADLKGQLKTLNEKSEVFDKFMSTYQLKPEEVATLQSPISAEAGSSISAEFFSAFARLREVRGSGRQLLRDSVLTSSQQSNMAPQRTALELMEFVASLEESAFDKLYRWAQAQCRSFSTDGAEPAMPSLVEGFALLAERPILLQCCIDEFVTVRRSAIAATFIDALTRGDVVAGSKPIELQAHDRVRYCSDVLAWVHQAMLLERDCLSRLLAKLNKSKLEGGEDMLRKVLSSIVDGVCRPLATRLEQVLANESDPFVLYLVLNILKFYLNTFESIVGNCQLCNLLSDIQEAALVVFNSSLAIRVASFLDNFDVSSDLFPPIGLKNGAKLMKDLAAAVDKNPLAAAAKSTQGGSAEIVEAIGRPFITAACALVTARHQVASVTNDADELSNEEEKLSPDDLFDNSDQLSVCVFVTNCLESLRAAAEQAMSSSDSTVIHDLIDVELQRVAERLSHHMAVCAMKMSGLQVLRERVDNSSSQIDESSFGLAFSTFDNLLQSGADLLTSMQVRQLMVRQSLIEKIRADALEVFMSQYSALYDKLKESTHFGNDARLKSPEQIRTFIV